MVLQNQFLHIYDSIKLHISIYSSLSHKWFRNKFISNSLNKYCVIVHMYECYYSLWYKVSDVNFGCRIYTGHVWRGRLMSCKVMPLICHPSFIQSHIVVVCQSIMKTYWSTEFELIQIDKCLYTKSLINPSFIRDWQGILLGNVDWHFKPFQTSIFCRRYCKQILEISWNVNKYFYSNIIIFLNTINSFKIQNDISIQEILWS